jgi:hypothetical protein
MGAALAALLFTTFIACAEDIKPSVPDEDLSTYTLEDLEVKKKAKPIFQAGKTEISSEYIKMLPKGNGNITDMLRLAPSVQFDEGFRSSKTAGEIAPEEMSISGGKPYQNLFLINGVNNSNVINPAEMSPYKVDDVSSGAQRFYTSFTLVDSVTLYDSNIPVEYDGFIGGVVDVKLRNPAKEFKGSIEYRTTRSEWTTFNISSEDRESFYNSSHYARQPKFDKSYTAVTLDVPVTDRFGLILSYDNTKSAIPLRQFEGWQTQNRDLKNYFVRGVYEIDTKSYIDFTGSYAPYEATYYIANTMDSEFTNTGGGWLGTSDYVSESDSGKLEIHVDASTSKNEREGNNIRKTWWASGTKPWGYLVDNSEESGYTKDSTSSEGSYGDLTTEQTNYTFRLSKTLKPIKMLGEHTLTYGVSAARTSGVYNKREDSISYNTAAWNSDVICDGDSDTCIDGEQYLSRRNITPADRAEVTFNEYDAYVQDELKIGRFSARLGLRVSNDDYSSNTNISPRTKFTYDIFGDEETVLVAGVNRYYDRIYLKNTLDEAKRPSYEEERRTYLNQLSEWAETTDGSYVVYNFADLKTPYTDEFMTGVDQKLIGGVFSVQYVKRHSKDDFATTSTDTLADGYFHSYLNNNGSSKYQSVQLKWERTWENHSLMVNGMWQKSNTSNNTYDNEYDLEDMNKKIMYDGEIIKVSDKPKDNFNRPYVFNLAYTGKFFDRLTVAPLINFRTAYKKSVLVDSSYMTEYTNTIDPETGIPVYLSVSKYEVKNLKPSFTMDCSFSWKQPLIAKNTLTLTLEVNNIFNDKNEIGSSSETIQDYELGRHFWAGVKYEF